MTIDDETLMAFADDQLAPDRMDEVEAACRADPALANRVERFRLVRSRLAQAVMAQAPAPRAGLMREALERTAAARPSPRKVVVGRWPMALAASVIGAVIGVAGGTYLRPGRSLDLEAGMVARGALAAGLTRTASGETRSGRGLDVRPIYTVTAADGRSCRAFSAVSSAAAVEGLACREGEVWRIAAAAPVARPAGGYVAAASGEPATVSAALAALKPGDPLSQAAEARLIAQGWAPR